MRWPFFLLTEIRWKQGKALGSEEYKLTGQREKEREEKESEGGGERQYIGGGRKIISPV
jgi:hypothetical protein